MSSTFPHTMPTVLTKNLFSHDLTWVTCFYYYSFTRYLHRVNTHFLTLLKMTEVSRNVDIIFLHIFYKKNFYSFFFLHIFLHIYFTNFSLSVAGTCVCNTLIISIFHPYFTILLYLHNEFFNP